MTKLLLSLFALWALPVVAQQVSVETAKRTACDFLSGQGDGSSLKSANISEVELAYTAEKDGERHFYVFNVKEEKGGFVIVGADEAAEQIIGYSEQGSFDYDKAPDNFKWWLEQYSLQIAEGIKSGVKADNKVENKSSKVTVAPLIQTQWSQSEPYNNAIPTVSMGGDQKCMTGCGATAVAQVMYYHKCPEAGKSKGQKSYTIYYEYSPGAGTFSYSSDPTLVPDYTTSTTFSADFGATDYQWNDMLNDYDGSSDTQSKNAVATLMYHVGVALNMSYTPSASSSSTADVVGTLTEYFDYDKSAEYVMRSYYTDIAWENLIYSELEAGRPVIYGGSTSSGGGHIFICDGYDAATLGKNKYHINWGWGGYCDGYYAITGTPSLDPDGNGIGGAGTGSRYTEEHEIVVNLKPNEGGDYVRMLGWDSGILSMSTVERGKEFYFKGGFHNLSTVDISFYLGAKLTNKSTSDTYYVKTSELLTLRSRMLYIGEYFPVSTNSIPEGEYYVSPVFKLEGGDWTEMRSVSVSTITITESSEPYVLTSDFAIGKNGEVKADKDAFTIRFTVKNNTSSPLTKTFSGIVFVENESGSGYTGAFELSEQSVTIPANSEVEICLTRGSGYAWKELVLGKEYMVRVQEGEAVIANYLGFDVVEEFTTGVSQVTGNKEAVVTGIYTLTGQRIEAPRKGINIIRMSDGSTQKMLVK